MKQTVAVPYMYDSQTGYSLQRLVSCNVEMDVKIKGYVGLTSWSGLKFNETFLWLHNFTPFAS
jgi:hypothetical protein